MTSAEMTTAALILFLANGALIIWTPLWSLCLPLWLGPVLMMLWSLVLLVKERRGGVGSRTRSLLVTVAACVVVTHAVLGANQVWFRCGVEWRLWRVGGRDRVETWAAQHVAALQTDWDRAGGTKGLRELPQTETHRFFWVHGTDRPAWLAPLTAYLPARVTGDDASRPAGINFTLSGWDHGWGLLVYATPQPDAARRPWISRLSDRAYLWGRP